jgi:hypothetical protein
MGRINPVPYKFQDFKLDKNYGLDLKLLHWYEPGDETAGRVDNNCDSGVILGSLRDAAV